MIPFFSFFSFGNQTWYLYAFSFHPNISNTYTELYVRLTKSKLGIVETTPRHPPAHWEINTLCFQLLSSHLSYNFYLVLYFCFVLQQIINSNNPYSNNPYLYIFYCPWLFNFSNMICNVFCSPLLHILLLSSFLFFFLTRGHKSTYSMSTNVFKL